MARAVSLSISLRHRGGSRLVQLGMSRAMVGVPVVYVTCLHGRYQLSSHCCRRQANLCITTSDGLWPQVARDSNALHLMACFRCPFASVVDHADLMHLQTAVPHALQTHLRHAARQQRYANIALNLHSQHNHGGRNRRRREREPTRDLTKLLCAAHACSHVNLPTLTGRMNDVAWDTLISMSA